ncbi:MAG: hypothetical protein LBE56_05805 [Tannerella sp.]|jgi:hypothetical protein|nr:hypothetical protein [Tannerella sp.]
MDEMGLLKRYMWFFSDCFGWYPCNPENKRITKTHYYKSGRFFPSISLVFTLLFSILFGCNDLDNYSTNTNLRLKFSVDTLSFDTIFTAIGSATKQFMVYNPNNEALKIESIMVANPEKSGFRINVDGRKGDAFYGIDIWERDSLYISVEVTVPPNGVKRPLVIEDSILFLTNGVMQYVLLQAYGQDIHIIKGGVVYTSDMTLEGDKPYLIYDSLMIAEGTTLTVMPGATLYMHLNASIIVAGTLKAVGSQENPIVIRGDRSDYIPLADMDLPYDLIPGQWKGMVFKTSSFDNEFDYVTVRNGLTGLTFEESAPERLKMRINNSQITNMDSAVFTATNCFIEVINSELSNAALSTVALTGGKYHFIHCSIVNYKRLGNSRERSCLQLSDYVGDDGASRTSFPLQEAFFDNCIIDGSWSADSTKQYGGEISLSAQNQDITGNDETFNYRFASSLIKTARVTSDRFVNCLFVTSPDYLKVGVQEEGYAFDFRLANESAGIGAADRSISELYPIDRYGVNRLSSAAGPSVGAYEYVFQEDDE